MIAYSFTPISVVLLGIVAICPARSHAQSLSGSVTIDGSSTVYPITEAVAEEFREVQPKVKVTVGIAGTGGGFKKFCAGEIDINDASRPIKSSEIELCEKNKIEYIELPVAYDALSVVVNPSNDWAKTLTVKELKTLWAPEAQGKITSWKQIRDGFPDKPVHLYGAGVDSGTYDYFTEAIVGKEHSSRGDFTSSEDDNVLVQGVSGDVASLGFFGLAYYHENSSRLTAVAIDDEDDSNGKGPQFPTVENVLAGVYRPLARPLFIYVRKESVARPEVQALVQFYLKNVSTLSGEVGYITLPANIYALVEKRLADRKLGSVMGKGAAAASLETLLNQ